MPPAVTQSPTMDAKVNENGRILIPAAIREQMGLKLGDSVVLTLEDGVLRVESYRAIIRKMQQEMKQYKKPGVSITDEFIAERREEARREREQGLG
jgi:AbrB family looped-hinge helix DNA binding protein